MMKSRLRGMRVFPTTIVLLFALSMNVAAQDTAETGDAGPSSQPASEAQPTSESRGAPLPGPLGECAGAELIIHSIKAPFGEPLLPWDELVARDGTLARAEVEYQLPEGATSAFVSFSVSDAAGLSPLGSEILERNPEARDINPDVHYSVDTIQGTIPDPLVGQRTSVSVDLNVVDEQSYLGMWAGWGVDPADYVDLPYAHGDRVRVFLTFELDGANYSWSSRSISSDCAVR